MTQQEEIVAAARRFLGAKWVHQARADDAMDCAGLVIKVAKELGFIDWDISGYAREAPQDAMLSICRAHLVEISRSELRPGDLVVLRYGSNHIGIVGDYPVPGHLSVIHAQATQPRCVVENRLCDEWLSMVRARITGCFRFPEKVA